MAKRLHYFDHQFLVEADFTDEQTYHLDMRRRHNRVLHTFGVAAGLQVEKTGDKEVTVRPGTAVDREGREMVLDADQILDLSTFSNNDDVYITIAYTEQETDPTTATGVTGNTRVTETPQVQAGTSVPPGDGSVVRLANFTLDGSGNVPGSNGDTFDAGLRQFAGSSLAPGSVGTAELADGAVTGDKIAGDAITADKIADLSISAADLANNSISEPKLANNSVSNRTIANLAVTGSKIANNAVTSGKIANGAVGTADIANSAVQGTKLANNAVTGTKIANNSIGEVKFDAATRGKLVTNGNSHDHDGSDGLKITPTNLAGVNSSVTASNLNTLTGGTTNASALHYHQSFPTQTKIYTPAFPFLEHGSSPKFTAAPYSARCPAGQVCQGITPVYLPPGYDMIRMGIETQSSSSFSMTFWLVYSNIGSSSGVLVRGINVTSAGLNETTFRHTIQPSRNYNFWVRMNSAPASIVTISGIYLEYEYSTL